MFEASMSPKQLVSGLTGERNAMEARHHVGYSLVPILMFPATKNLCPIPVHRLSLTTVELTLGFSPGQSGL